MTQLNLKMAVEVLKQVLDKGLGFITTGPGYLPITPSIQSVIKSAAASQDRYNYAKQSLLNSANGVTYSSSSSGSNYYSSSSSASSSSASYAVSSDSGVSTSMVTRYGRARKYYRRGRRFGARRTPMRRRRSYVTHRRTAAGIAAGHPEKKYSDQAINMQAGIDRTITSSHLISPIYIGSLGTAQNNRSSASPVLSSLTVRGKLLTATPSGSVGTPTRWSFFIVQDTAPLSTMPVNGVSDIFSTVGASMPTSLCVNNMDNSSRFKILKRIDISFGAFPYPTTVSGGQTQACVPIDFTLPLKFTQKYKPTSSTSTIGDITENALYMVALSDSFYASSPMLVGLCRVHFYDR